MDTEKVRLAMQDVVDGLHDLADQFFNLSLAMMAGTPQNAPNPQVPASQPSAPSNAPTPQNAPTKAAPVVSNEVKALISDAITEAQSLERQSHDVRAVLKAIASIGAALDYQDLANRAAQAIDSLDALKRNNVDVSVLHGFLHQIETKATEKLGAFGGHGTLVNDTEEAGRDLTS